MSFPKAVSQEAMNAYNKAKKQIESAVVERAMKDKKDIVQHGDKAEDILRSGISFTSEIMASAMTVGEPGLLKDQIEWSKSRLVHDGVDQEQIKKRFQYFIQEIERQLPQDYSTQIVPFFDWMIRNYSKV